MSHCGRNLGLPLLFLAKELVTVTDVPEAGFGEERSALSTLYFNLQRHNSFLEASLSQSSTQLFAYRGEANERPSSVFCTTC